MLNSTKPQSYWDECLPSSNPLKEHDYVRIQEDPGAKDLACDNPELAAAIGVYLLFIVPIYHEWESKLVKKRVCKNN